MNGACATGSIYLMHQLLPSPSLPAGDSPHLQPRGLGGAKGPHDPWRGGRHLHIHLPLIQLPLPSAVERRVEGMPGELESGGQTWPHRPGRERWHACSYAVSLHAWQPNASTPQVVTAHL